MTIVKPKANHPWKTAAIPPKSEVVRPFSDYSRRSGAIYGHRLEKTRAKK